jgi:hypothetical protein
MSHATTAPDDTGKRLNRLAGRKCANCPDLFAPGSPNARFCGDPCRKAFNNRNTAQGGPLVPLLKAWRASRNAKGKTAEAVAARQLGALALNEICAIVDSFMAGDREEGRTGPDAIAYVRELYDIRGDTIGRRYIDRQQS